MKKIVLTALASALLFSSVAGAANLMIDEKSKSYDYKAALAEINNSMTAIGVAETETAQFFIKPFFHSFVVSGSAIAYNGLPFQKPKSMLEKANGYIFASRGKSFAIESMPMAGIVLMVVNKKEKPLVIDINNSVLHFANFYGQPFYAGKYADQGNYSQPNLLVPPKQSKTVVLYRSDAKFESHPFSTGWYLPPTPVDFNKIHAEATLKVDDKYVYIVADGAIPEEIQKKYDQATQMAKKK